MKPQTTFFLLSHDHELPQDCTDTKVIGLYSTRANAEAAVKFLSTKPGFCKSKSGFQIGLIELDKTAWEDGFDTYKY
jgi:hypothetical protein